MNKPKIRIVLELEITDPETVEVYSEVVDDLIGEDLRDGSLFQVCDIVKIEKHVVQRKTA